MAFPGHFKSLQLSQLIDTLNGDPTTSPAKHVTSSRKNSSSNAWVPNTDDDIIAEGRESNKPKRQDTLDDKGNRPTRSLWVGNIPQDLDSPTLRTAFVRYGNLRSTKILRGMRCAFVNFENITDAITAWRTCHESELFEPGCVVHVRFTGTENEAKQAKDQVPTRKTSLSKAFEPVQRSHPRKNSGNENLQGRNPLWPNGLPPAGPKSERRNVSPPPLRKGDSYRPSGRVEPERRSSQSSRRFVDDRDNQRTHDIYRPSYESAFQIGGSTDKHSNIPEIEHSPASNLVDGEHVLSILSERHESTPYSPPAEISSLIQVDQEILESPCSDIAGRNFSLRSPTSPKILLSEYNLRQKCLESGECGFSTSRSIMEPVQNQIQCPGSVSPETNMTDPVGVLTVHFSPEREAFNEASESARSRRSRMLSPLQRLRYSNDDTSSVVSDWTTSSKSSMRRRKCADCKKPESSVMILVPCSTCPRRFHSSCGDPRPSLGDQSRYVCGRCLKKQNRLETLEMANLSKASKMLATVATANFMRKDLSPTRQQVDSGSDYTIEKFHEEISSRPVRQTVEISPQNLHIYSSSRRSTLSSEQPAATLITQSPIKNHFLSQPQLDGCSEASPMANQTPTAVQRSAQRTKEAYKHVTCPWWRKDPEHGCSLEESQCMFVHRETGIYSPDGHSPAKHWTCRRWYLTKDCQHSKETCLYAHKDKGLYVGLDGKASKKHITCFWWKTNGRCKHSEDECLFTHHDTGIYARDPGWTAHGNSTTTSTSTSAQFQRLRLDSDLSRGASSTSRIISEGIHIGSDILPDEAEVNLLYSLEDVQTSRRVDHRAAFRLEDETAVDLHSKRNEPLMSSKHIFAFRDLEDETSPVEADTEKDIAAVPDPRKLRRERTEPSKLQGSSASLVPGVEGRNKSQRLISNVACGPAETNTLASAESGFAERSLQGLCSLKKKCKSCMKTIFSGEVCVGCKPSSERMVLGRMSPATVEEDLGQPRLVISSKSPRLDDLVAHEFDMPDLVQDTTFETRQLKRKPSQEAMFVSNKRSKLNPQAMASRYRPRGRPEKHSSTAELDKAEIEKKNLQQLLSREKATEIISPPSADANKENRRPAESTCSSDLTSPVELDSAQPPFFSNPDPIDHDNVREAYDSAAPNVVVECPPLTEHAEKTSANSQPTDNNIHFTATEPGTPSNSTQSNLSFSDGQDVEIAQRNDDAERSLPTRNQSTACKDCSRRHMRCVHFDRTLSKRTVNMESVQVDVCDHCRQKHKKCLHQPDGELDGKKCFEWLQDRNRRGTASSDRKKDEQMAIDEAARRYELSSCKAPSRGPSVSTFSEEEIIHLDSEDDQDETSTAATSHTEHETDQFISIQVQKGGKINLSEDSVDISRPVVPLMPQHKSKNLSLSLLEPPETQKAFNPGESTSQDCSERRKHNNVTLIDDQTAIQKMKRLGITFESDSEGDYDEPIPVLGQPVPPTSKPRHFFDPLRQRDQIRSRDLYRLFPESDPNKDKSGVHFSNQGIPSITKGQGLKDRKLLRRRTLLRNLRIHGNANWEVNRSVPDAMVSALVEKTVAPSQEARLRDRYAPDSIETTSQTITFSDFLGVSEAVEPCLIGKGSGAILAFRDMPKDDEMNPWLFGKRRRVGEAEKWPVQDK